MSTSNADLDQKLLEQAIKTYVDCKAKIKDLDKIAQDARELIANKMHEYEVNELIVDIDGIKYKCAYQNTTRKNVDFTILMEEVGPHKFNEIVNEKESTSLYIKTAPKEKNSSKTSQAPAPDRGIPKTPTGVIS